MIKKILIFLFLTILFTGCGKKGDPIYNDETQNSRITSSQKNLLS